MDYDGLAKRIVDMLHIYDPSINSRWEDLLPAFQSLYIELIRILHKNLETPAAFLYKRFYQMISDLPMTVRDTETFRYEMKFTRVHWEDTIKPIKCRFNLIRSITIWSIKS